MAATTVPPRSAVAELEQLLNSPEIKRLIQTIKYIRWTGRPGYPVEAMVGMTLVKSMYAIPTWSRTCRLVADHDGLQRVLGCAPSQWACYRFAKMLSGRDNWVLSQCINDVLAGLKEAIPELGKDIAIDGSSLPAYANGHRLRHDGTERTSYSDPDASWGHRSAVSTHKGGGFYGYKLHAAVDVATDLPIAWAVDTAKTWEAHHALPLIDKAKRRGFDVKVAIMDKGYDNDPLQDGCMLRGVSPVVALKDTAGVKKGAAKPPCCEHGEWTFAGADYTRRATKWRCPTGECTPASTWVQASRLHPLIPRDSNRFKDLYRKRGSIEREFGRLKHEWALLPLRVRGINRVQLHADLTVLAKLSARLRTERELAQTARSAY